MDQAENNVIIIHNSDGSTQEGILLSLQGDTVRIAGKGSDDVLEFRLIHGNWISENCDVVTFEFPLAVFEAIGIMPDGPRQSVGAPVPECHAAAPACWPVN
jgi:hypothetical protein